MNNKRIVINIIFILFLGLTFKTYAQPGVVCWKMINGKRVVVSCEDFVPPTRPSYTKNWDIDSLERNMEQKLIYTVNNHRRKLGMNELKYSDRLYNEITLPHNIHQTEVNFASHNDDTGNGLKERCPKVDFCGFRKVSENVASHQRWETDGISLFFEQYMRSEKHKNMIENPEFIYYSVSVIYDYDSNTFYNTLNVSR